MATKEQLMSALRKADAAGDAHAAQRFAAMIREKKFSDAPEPANKDSGEPGIAKSLLIGSGAGLLNTAEGVEQFGRESTLNAKVEQLKQLYKSGRLSEEQLKLFEESIEEDRKALDEFNQAATDRRESFDKTEVGQSISGNIGEFAGEVAPALLVPGTTQKKLAQQVLSGLAGGAIIGGTQFVEEGESRADNAVTGAALGGFAPLPIKAIGKGVGTAKDFIVPFLGVKTTNLIKQMGGEELLNATAKRISAAKRLGLDFITPAEATGDTLLAKRQGNIGTSETGFKLLNKASLKRQHQEKEAITRFLEGLSPDSGSANKAIQQRAKKILKVEKYMLSRAARPFYKSAYKQEIPEEKLQELMADPILSQQYKKILSNPAYQRELGNTPLNSIKTIDIVKRSLGDDIEVALRAGNNNEARIIKDAQRSLLSAADEFSPDYAQARKIFSTGSPSVEKLEKGIIGKLANLDPKSLKTVSKTLFDPNETDPHVLTHIRDKISKGKGKAVWGRIVRNEFERRIDQSAQGQTGTTIFKKALEKDRDFKMFLSATKHMPGTRQALIDMRRVFKDLIDPKSVRGAAKLASDSTNVARSSAEFLVNKGRDILSGKKDKLLVDIITDPNWQKELNKALKADTKKLKVLGITNLLEKAAASQADEINSSF